MADKTNGLEAWRLLRREMEPREKARALAMVRQSAAWKFDDIADLQSQLVRYEEALRTYEASSGKPFPEDLVLATVVTELREPLKSADVREWILRYESLNAPWANTRGGKSADSRDHGEAQPMEVDVMKGKGQDKGKKGKQGKGKD